MPWIQLIIESSEEQLPNIEECLLQQGALAVTLQDNADQPLFEPPVGTTPLWNQTRLTALFEADHNIAAVITALKHRLLPEQDSTAMPPYKVEALEDKNWEREWLSNFKPMRFGQRLWVIPSGFDAPTDAEICMHLDPGLAFGTGTHETTALCMEWLDSQQLDEKTVLDFGCGSGILAIAALLLGAQQAAGIDNDPQALLASHANAEKNTVLNRLTLFSPEQNPHDQYEIVVANILAGPLVELSPLIAAHTQANGLLALSGVLQNQAEHVADAYRHWFEITSIISKGDWSLILGRKFDATVC